MEWDVLEPVDEVAEADWLGDRFDGPLGTVGATVPSGYPAYARILHPVDSHNGNPSISWAQVAARTGRVVHARAQWQSIAPEELWSEGWPEVGCLTTSALTVLLDLLGDQPAWFALWEGWGWIAGPQWMFSLGDNGERTDLPVEPALSPETLALPRLSLPFRRYLLFRGPLRGVLRMGHQLPRFPFQPQSPNLFWPADRSWCAATEIDFDSTLIGGPRELVDAILAAPGLEAFPIDPEDSLTIDADTVNGR